MPINHTISDVKAVLYPVAASVAHNRGDLLYFDSNANVVKGADIQADQLTQPKNQRLFASLFAGVCQDKRLSTQDTAGSVVVVADGVHDCPCDSATFKVGDLVGAQEQGNGTQLEPQKVIAVTDPSLAIGYVVRDVPSAATSVRCRLISKFIPASKPDAPGYSTGQGGAVTQITNRSTGVTLNTPTGQITTDTTSLAAEAAATFTVTNSCVEIGDVVAVSIQSGTNGGNTAVTVTTVAAGSFALKVSNNNAAAGTAETGAIIINYAIIKAKGS